MKLFATVAVGGAWLIVMAGSGCGHAPQVETRGSTAFRVVEPPRPPPQVSDREMVEPVNRANYREAQAIHPLVLPVYPPAALATKAGAAMIGVRVTIDTNGAVADVRPSMLVVNVAPPAFAEEFREAVEVAVRQWRFAPARVHYLERVTEGEFTYERVVRTESVEAEFDLAFTFTPSGRVEAGEAK